MQAHQRKNRSGKPPLKSFKKDPPYPHLRSEGLTHRNNRGTCLQTFSGKFHSQREK